ncbi:MAG: DsrE family protein [Ancrocorticia sp.]|jgi:intracellular sulfur oxidation DsrE/DsrF family protein|nr:DsrE family protein [Ancrocorticia sp.]MCI1896517.1 DsrE family protein [Ancrocorticia sp.]MCI1933186.1 DsrE family protein [Ancrocorticia sp.]MCI1963831.1 DsrE family protein [Ancrocorticia sp.]MCI2002169.1 DsrE family protein [Ancrocorticia sp.]
MTNVIFHIDEESRWEQLLSNLEYFAAAHATDDVIEVVINGPAVRSFNGFDVHPEYGNRISALVKLGVRFVICGNSLKNRQIPNDNIPESISIVPQGIEEIVARESEGYAYIKP